MKFRGLCVALMMTTIGMWSGELTAGEQEDRREAEQMSQTLELGANLRTDFGVHVVRIDMAWRIPNFRVLLTVDPLFWLDGKSSTDLLAMWRTAKVEPFAGWRLNTVSLLEGSQLQHNLVLGTALPFPEFFDGALGGQWGIEMAMMLVKHGGGIESNTIGFDSGRHYIDLVNFGMFARFHYNLELR